MPTKVIRALLGFTAVPDGNVLSRALAVFTGLTDNATYPHPPIDLTVLKTKIDSFQALIAEALDGSKKPIAKKKKDRRALITILRKLGPMVKASCNDEMAPLHRADSSPPPRFVLRRRSR